MRHGPLSLLTAGRPGVVWWASIRHAASRETRRRLNSRALRLSEPGLTRYDLGVQEVEFECPLNCLVAIVHTEFSVDAAQLCLDGVVRDEQTLGDLVA